MLQEICNRSVRIKAYKFFRKILNIRIYNGRNELAVL